MHTNCTRISCSDTDMIPNPRPKKQTNGRRRTRKKTGLDTSSRRQATSTSGEPTGLRCLRSWTCCRVQERTTSLMKVSTIHEHRSILHHIYWGSIPHDHQKSMWHVLCSHSHLGPPCRHCSVFRATCTSSISLGTLSRERDAIRRSWTNRSKRVAVRKHQPSKPTLYSLEQLSSPLFFLSCLCCFSPAITQCHLPS